MLDARVGITDMEMEWNAQGKCTFAGHFISPAIGV
jgi:hypothetical protein